MKRRPKTEAGYLYINVQNTFLQCEQVAKSMLHMLARALAYHSQDNVCLRRATFRRLA